MSAYRSVCCPDSKLVYDIRRDAYICLACQKEYEVLSVEEDHILFDGGPPKEVA